MVLFGKDYSEEFNEIKSEIKTLQSRVSNRSDRDLIKIQDLENEVKTLIQQNNQLIREVVEIKQVLSNQEPTGLVTENIVIAKNKKKYSHNRPIQEYANFSKYATPREYDMKKGKFINPKNRRRTLNLNFEQLVVIIKGHLAGRGSTELTKHPLLSNMTPQQIIGNVYIWRAGGFNQAIKDNARKLGYNPNKLLSHEVDGV